MMKRELFLACLLGAAVAVTACGDDEDELPDGSIRVDARAGGPAGVDARTVDGAVDAPVAPDAGVDARADAGADAAAPDAAPDASPDAAATPSWTTIYTQVITPVCLPCHSGTTQIGVTLGHLDMSTQAAAFANLVNVAAAGPACTGAGGIRVVPGSPTTSLLYLKVGTDTAAPCGAKMPLTGSITEAQAEAIEAWIMGGAPNN